MTRSCPLQRRLHSRQQMRRRRSVPRVGLSFRARYTSSPVSVSWGEVLRENASGVPVQAVNKALREFGLEALEWSQFTF